MNMKKIFRHILFLAMTITAVASCEDDRNNFLPEDSFGFNNKAGEGMITLPIYGGSHDIAVIKSGKGLNEGEVKIKFGSGEDVVNYNKDNGTDFVWLPAERGGQELYSLTAGSLAFGLDEVSKSFSVVWDIAKVAEFMAGHPENEGKYCIPVSLVSENLEVNEGRGLYLINLVTSTVTAEQALLSRTYEWESEPTAETMDITVRIDKAIPGIDLTLNYEVDETLVEAYNMTNRTNYALAPEGLVTFGADPVIKAGEGYALFPVTINTDAIAEDMEVEVNGVMETRKLVKRDWDGYVVPLKISSMSVDGVKVNNALTYVVIKGLEPIPPQLFNYLWGVYATSSTSPWQSTFGLSDCRNITMDDQYIYIPQSAGGDPVLKAVSITDPTIVKNVNVEGISSGTHTLSCVRMIPNTDPAINGGKDILVASNLTLGGEAHMNYYVWLNGIDNAPEKHMVDDSGRRMGDKFTVIGSWKNGEIYIKDYNTGNIVRNAMVSTGIGEWPQNGLGYARGRYDYSASVLDAANCIGAAYVYPGTPKAGSDIVPGFLVTSTSSGHWLSNTTGNVFASTADLGLGMTHGYNFFTDEKTGSKYVAYMSITPDQTQSSVKVISDFNGTYEGLVGVLQNQKLIFEAPLQDSIDPTVVSACPSTHSTGDCVVRTVGSKTYMVAMHQNVGLAVYVLNAGFKVD